MGRWVTSMTVTAMMVATKSAHGYLVGPAVPLEQLAKQVDVVCKGTVVSSLAVVDPTFDAVPGFEARETTLNIAGCFKGAPGREVRFRHYSTQPSATVFMYAPLHYEFDIGRSYWVFAIATKVPKVYRQFQAAHTQKPDQGVVLAADDKPRTAPTVSELIHGELAALLANPTAADTITAIEQLDSMSGGRMTGLHDFDRRATLTELRPLILAKDPTIATAAITAIGRDGLYFDDESMQFSLATVGKGTIAGLSPRAPAAVDGGDLATKELMQIATADHPLRALAIRALGATPAVPRGAIIGWSKDPDVAVRAAATVVSHRLADRGIITAAVTDKAWQVRRAAAFAIGFSRDPKLLERAAALLSDSEGKVRAAAALAILSFGDPAVPTMRALLKSDYRALFVNAIARKDPAPYIGELADVIEKNLQPSHWWGGTIPAADSWEILFAHVKARPAGELTSPAITRALDGLERMRWYSSAQPRNLYALYVRRGLTSRAKLFRAHLKSAPFDMTAYLDQADQHPEWFVD